MEWVATNLNNIGVVAILTAGVAAFLRALTGESPRLVLGNRHREALAAKDVLIAKTEAECARERERTAKALADLDLVRAALDTQRNVQAEMWAYLRGLPQRPAVIPDPTIPP